MGRIELTLHIPPSSPSSPINKAPDTFLAAITPTAVRTATATDVPSLRILAGIILIVIFEGLI